MSTLFTLLCMLSLAALVWGLIEPSSFSKYVNKPVTRKEAGIGLGLTTFVFMILTGVTAPLQAKQEATNDSATKAASIQNQPKEIKGAPVVITKEVTETEAIAYSKVSKDDSTLAKGKTTISQKGVDGVKTKTYLVTFTDGKESDKKLIKEEMTTAPTNEVTSVGTYVYVAPKPASNCDPNYSGKCVPIASDVDCAGGSGNGPAYVSGPVTVIGSDIYDLDRDGDGIGCE